MTKLPVGFRLPDPDSGSVRGISVVEAPDEPLKVPKELVVG